MNKDSCRLNLQGKNNQWKQPNQKLNFVLAYAK